eukprot:jgi/Undpi1/217/HiC_scaffold_1.g00214.m1
MSSREVNGLTPCHSRSGVLWAWDCVSWGSRSTWQGVDPAAMQPTWTPATHVTASVPEQGAQRLGIRHRVESGEPFTADRNLWMVIVDRRRGLRDAPNREYRDKSILLGVTHSDPQ